LSILAIVHLLSPVPDSLEMFNPANFTSQQHFQLQQQTVSQQAAGMAGINWNALTGQQQQGSYLPQTSLAQPQHGIGLGGGVGEKRRFDQTATGLDGDNKVSWVDTAGEKEDFSKTYFSKNSLLSIHHPFQENFHPPSEKRLLLTTAKQEAAADGDEEESSENNTSGSANTSGNSGDGEEAGEEEDVSSESEQSSLQQNSSSSLLALSQHSQQQHSFLGMQQAGVYGQPMAQSTPHVSSSMLPGAAFGGGSGGGGYWPSYAAQQLAAAQTAGMAASYFQHQQQRQGYGGQQGSGGYPFQHQGHTPNAAASNYLDQLSGCYQAAAMAGYASPFGQGVSWPPSGGLVGGDNSALVDSGIVNSSGQGDGAMGGEQVS